MNIKKNDHNQKKIARKEKKTYVGINIKKLRKKNIQNVSLLRTSSSLLIDSIVYTVN